MEKRRLNNKRVLGKVGAFSEISLMIVSVFAIAFLIGMTNIEVVSGQNTGVDRNVYLEQEYAKIGNSNPTPPPAVTPVPVDTGKITPLPVNTGAKVYTGKFQGVVDDKTLSFKGYEQVGTGADAKYIGIAEDGTRHEFAQGKFEEVTKGVTFTQAGVAPEYSADLFGYFKVEGNLLGHLAEGFNWALAVVGVIQLVGNLAGMDPSLTNSLSFAAAGGIMAYKSAIGLFGEKTATFGGGIVTEGVGGLSNAQAGLIGVGVAVAIFVLMYKKEKVQRVTFQCLPWEAPIGGAKCEDCNKDPMKPCSEYRCKSLGQACQLLNVGTNEEKCAWVNPKDVNSPVIAVWGDSLRPSDQQLKYIPDTAIRPPALGAKIVRGNNACLAPYTPLEFGITLNEPARCKIDVVHTNKMEDMRFYVGESNAFRYNHTEKLRLPAPATQIVGGGSGNTSAPVEVGSDGAPVIQNDGTMQFYIRCQDANGNENVDEFSVSFCVDKGPDTTPPIIESSSINSGSPVTYNIDNVPIELYVSEPADCKWGRQDKPYDDLENQMVCLNSPRSITPTGQYICRSNLTAITNQQTNDFYFRCRDQPDASTNNRNTNVQSYKLSLRGTQPLNILNVGPNETIMSSTTTAKVNLGVTTDDGADEGKALCLFSPDGTDGSYIAMFNTNNFAHSQELDLTAGTYTYYFRCLDAGGNSASSNTTFNVFIDKQMPRVTRVYKDSGDALKVVTDEDAECRYSLSDCNFVFADGTAMLLANPTVKTQHYVKWDATTTYRIKCKDIYGNEPSPNACSVIVRPTQFEKK